MSAYIYGYNFTDEDKPKAARERFSDPRAFYSSSHTTRRTPRRPGRRGGRTSTSVRLQTPSTLVREQ